MAKRAKRQAARRAPTGEPKPKKLKRGKAEICGCPAGSRARTIATAPGEKKPKFVAGGATICTKPDGARVERQCGARRTYVVGGPSVSPHIATPSTFDYSTPSTNPQIGREARQTCVTKFVEAHAKKDSKDGKVKKGQVILRKRPLPFRCPPGSKPDGVLGEQSCLTESGASVPSIPDVSCGPTGDPCATGRTACPVQLVYKRGKPMLRFCVKAGNKKPGWLVPVATATEANRVATWACGQWSDSGGEFTADNIAQTKARAAGAGYTGPDKGLGRRAKYRVA